MVETNCDVCEVTDSAYFCEQCEQCFCEDCWNNTMHEDQESDEDYQFCGECWEEMKGEPNEEETNSQ